MRFTDGNAFSSDIAVDLGTANTLVYVAGRGILIDEPTLVAMRAGPAGREVWAVGAAAAHLLGRTPEALEAVWPLSDGVIGDFVAAGELLRQFLRRCRGSFTMRAPRVLVSVPPGATAVERRAVREAAEDAGARRVFLIAEPVAAALGAGLPVDDDVASMVIDIGGGTTDLAVLAGGQVVRTRTIRQAGHTLDDAIVRLVRRKHGLSIDRLAAERIKIELAVGARNGKPPQPDDIYIRGPDQKTGRLKTVSLSHAEVGKALQRPIGDLADMIELFLDELPAAIAKGLKRRRICVTGGGALLPDIEHGLRRRLGLPVFVPADPLRSVIKGSAIALGSLGARRGLLLTD